MTDPKSHEQTVDPHGQAAAGHEPTVPEHERATPQHEQGAFTGSRGRRIVWRGWGPDTAPVGVVTIAHGYGEHIGRYERLAGDLTAAGYQVYGLDHHGHGSSEGRPRQVVLADAVNDLDRLITTIVRERHPGLPQFLLGHSMGGAITLRYAIAHQDRLDGIVVSAPLADVAEGPFMRRLAHVLGRVLPGLPVSRVSPKLVSRDPNVVDAYVADPRNYHGMISARVAAEFIRHIESLPAGVRGITIPTLLIWGTADGLCPPSGSEMLARELGSADLTVTAYEGLFHEILNEPERETVVADVLTWLDRRSRRSA